MWIGLVAAAKRSPNKKKSSSKEKKQPQHKVGLLLITPLLLGFSLPLD